MARENDFTKPIKELAAKKVGYLCSCPNCHRITLGSNHDGDNSVSVGQAAHIYPASEGFSRYDPSISSDFIKSEKNCLWLCPTHHTLVDKDPGKFTSGELLIWKKDAEKFASDQLELSTIKFGNLKDKKYDIDLLDSILYDYLKEGQLIRLFNIVRLLDNSNSDVNLKQLFSYYRIIIYYYNNTSLLSNELKHFFLIDNKLYKSKVISFLIENQEKEMLSQLKMMIPDELSDLASIIINEEIIGRIISFDEDAKLEKISASNETLSKLFSNFIYYDMPEYRTIIENVFDNDKKFYSNEFIYKVHATIISLMNKIEKNYSYLDHEIIKDEEYLWLVSNKGRVSEYDIRYQVDFWKFLISVNTAPDRIDSFLEQVPNNIREHPTIEFMQYGEKLKGNFDENTFEELKLKSLEINNYALLISYLKFGMYDYTKLIFKFLDENRMLLEESSDILQTWIEVNEICGVKVSIIDFRAQFDDIYINDILYHCILSKLYFDDTNEEFKSELIIINDLFKKRYTLSIYGLDFYITILERMKEYEILLDVIRIPKQIDTKIRIASILVLSQENKYSDIGKKILEDIQKTGYKSAGLFHSIAIDYTYRGQMQKAKDYFGKSYELKKTPQNAYNYFASKLSNGEELSSEDINYCHISGDHKLIEILLSYYLRKSNVGQAKELFIRYFLMAGESNLQMLKSYFHYLSLHSNKPKKLRVVDLNCTVEISSDKHVLNITIHNDLALKDLKPKNFFDSQHFSISDLAVSDIVYKKSGDKCVFNGENYTITQIKEMELHFYHYLINVLEKQNLIQTLKGDPNNPEEAIKNIVEILRIGHDQTQRIINEYNDNPITPITMLSKLVGKSTLDTIEFINLGNEKQFINNLAIRKNNKFLISYDVFLTVFDLFEKKLLISYDSLFISQTTKTMFIQEIENDLLSLDSYNNTGTMIMIEGKATYVNDEIEKKANRKRYLHSLKNFIIKLNVVDPVKTEFSKNELIDFLGKNDLLIDRDTLITAHSNKGMDLVTDNVFLYGIANQLEINNCGLVDFLNHEIVDINKLIDVIIILSKRRYKIFISLDMLHLLNMKYLGTKIEEREQVKKRMIDVFACKLVEGNGDIIVNGSKELMIELYRSYYHNYPDNMSDLIDILGTYALEYYKEFHFEELQQKVQARINKLFFR